VSTKEVVVVSLGVRVGSTGRWLRRVAATSALAGGALLLGTGASAQSGVPRVLATTVDGPITPVIADHLADGMARAERDGHQAYLIRLDTPGGLDSSMREIVQEILASDVPVIVYVSPPGARGASAGAIITFAAHVAAMAPGTAIGAATPVGGQGGDDLEDKIINDAIAYAASLAELRDRDVDFVTDTVRKGRSASASEALEVGAIDVVAGSEAELLDEIDGRSVTVTGDLEVVLETASAEIEQHDLGLLRAIQQRLADPNIAFLLLSIGTLGLIYELASPGLGVGGALGLTFVLLAMFGLAVLPVDVVGLLFLALAAALFVAEVFAPGIGLAAAGGALSLVLSGIFLFDDVPGLQLSLAVVLPTALVVGLFVVVAGRIALRSRRAPSTTTGPGLLIGSPATVRLTHGAAQVFVQGAWWSATSRDPNTALDDGAIVEIVDVEGLKLVVDPVSAPTRAESDQEGVQ
jgi:membrane-bound serine protease (ClpP class)